MAKTPRIDWTKAKEQWAKDHAKTGISPSEWCAKNHLPYSTAKRHITLKTAKEFAPNSQKAANIRNKAPSQAAKTDKTAKTANTTSPPPIQHDVIQSKPTKQPKQKVKDKGGAPRGNQNARKHGFYSRFVRADLLLETDEVSSEMQLSAIRALEIETWEAREQYRADLEKIKAEIADQCRAPTEEEYDRMTSIGRSLDSCDSKIAGLIGRADNMVNNADNRLTNRVSRERVVADTKRIKVDTDLKSVGIDLAVKNTAKAKAQTDLSVAQLKALDKDEGGKKDDLDEVLDEIMDQRDGLMSEMPEVDS